MRISARLSFSMWILMILVISLGVYSVQYSHSIDKPFSDVARVSRNRAMTVSVAKNMAEMRQNVWQGLVTNDTVYWQTADNLMQTIQSQFDTLRKNVIIPERQALLREIEGMFLAYLDLYARLKELKAQNIPVDREDFQEVIRESNKNVVALEEKGEQLSASYERYSENTITTYQSLMADFREGSLGVAFLSILMGILVWYITYRSIVPPLKNMTKAMDALSHWDLSVDVPKSRYHDEIEAMGKAVEVFKANALKLEALHQDLKRATTQAGAERKVALRSMADKFEESIKDVAMIMALSVKEIKEGAPVPASSADADQVARALSEAATKMGHVILLMSDLATETSLLASSAKSGDQLRAVQEETNRALDSIRDVAKTLDALRELSTKIAGSFRR